MKMKVCYLNVTIGVLSALSVALVGVVALLVTATISIEKLQASAEAHAHALGTSVAKDVAQFIHHAEHQSRAMARNCLMLPFARRPTEHPTAAMSEAEWHEKELPFGGVTFGRWSEFMRAQVLESNMSAFMQNIWFVDGTRTGMLQGSQDHDVLFHEMYFPSNVSTPAVLNRSVMGYLISTQAPAPASHVGAKTVVDYRNTLSISLLQDSGSLFDTYMRLSRRVDVNDTAAEQAHAARFSNPTWTSLRFVHRGGPQWYRMSVTRLYNASLDIIGFGLYGLNVPSFSNSLDGQLATKGSRSVAIDDKGYLLGASGGRETLNYSTFAAYGVNSTTVVALYDRGCTSTDVTRGPAPSDEDMVSCQHHISNFNDPAIRAVGESGGWGVDTIMKVKGAGDTFYVSMVLVAGVGMPATVIAVVPEEDVLGNVRSIFLIAGLVTCGVVLVSSGLLISLVFVSLRPLKGIAERMGKTARLEDTAQDRVAWKGRSVMAEIADLEDAFEEMSHELNRIRAFVPQSLLRAVKRTSSDDSGEDDHHTDDYHSLKSGTVSDASSGVDNSLASQPEHSIASSNSEHRSGSELSPRARPTPPHRPASASGASARGGGGGAAAARRSAARAAAMTADQILKRVSVLFLNVRGFHSKARVAAASDANTISGFAAASGGASLVSTRRVAAMVDAVLAIVNDQKGVVDYFHGDRFMVTFNAATICAGHASRAVTTAAKIKAVLRDGKSLADVLSEKAMLKRTAAVPDSPLSKDLNYSPFAAGSYGSCGITCGVASGVAQVGNLGISDMMRFTTVGPVVSQAAALERLCKVYTVAPTVNRGTVPAPVALVSPPLSPREQSPASLPLALPEFPEERPSSSTTHSGGAHDGHERPRRSLEGERSPDEAGDRPTLLRLPSSSAAMAPPALSPSSAAGGHPPLAPPTVALAGAGEETSVLIGHSLFDDASTCAALRFVDYVRLPFHRRGSLIAAVESELDLASCDREWLYQIAPQESLSAVPSAVPSPATTSLKMPSTLPQHRHRSNSLSMKPPGSAGVKEPRLYVNAVWRELSRGQPTSAAAHLAALRNVVGSSADPKSQRDVAALGVGRLEDSIVAALQNPDLGPVPRDLGIFYSTAVAHE